MPARRSPSSSAAVGDYRARRRLVGDMRVRDGRSTTPTSTRSPHRRRPPTAACRPTPRWSAWSTALAGPDDVRAHRGRRVPRRAGQRLAVRRRCTRSTAEYGFSCMGYEIAGGWGAKMALPDREVVVFVGDGSYLMMNSDLYSSVLSGHKLIVIVCDNGGFAVINRLQINQGGVPFNNLIADIEDRRARCASTSPPTPRRWAATPRRSARSPSSKRRSCGLAMPIAPPSSPCAPMPTAWTEGGAFWEVGVPEVSDRAEVRAARAALDAGKADQRVGMVTVGAVRRQDRRSVTRFDAGTRTLAAAATRVRRPRRGDRHRPRRRARRVGVQ